MTKLILCLALVSTVLLSGCVRRTVSTDSGLGSKSQGKVIDDRLIWIWQDEFRQPK